MENKTDFQTITVDFDGTLCYSKWPELGQLNHALIAYLKEWKRNGNNSRKVTCDYYIDDRMLLPDIINEQA